MAPPSVVSKVPGTNRQTPAAYTRAKITGPQTPALSRKRPNPSGVRKLFKGSEPDHRDGRYDKDHEEGALQEGTLARLSGYPLAESSPLLRDSSLLLLSYLLFFLFYCTGPRPLLRGLSPHVRRTGCAWPPAAGPERRCIPGPEPVLDGHRDDRAGDPQIDRLDHRPAALAQFGTYAAIPESRGYTPTHGRQVQQPRADHAAMPPDLGDPAQIQTEPPSVHFSSNPSAYACIRPYSIPLWTILT